jgi:hypothetical protein
LVLVLNNNDQWNGETITTKWQNRRLVPKAWRGKDNADVPMEKWTDDSGSTDLWAPPRGYVVYVPM